MVSIIEKILNNKKIYYLHHTLRTKDGFKNIDKYLGSKLPNNLEEIKINFFKDIYKEKLDQIAKIKLNKAKDYKKLPLSIKNKELTNFSIQFTYNTNKIEGSTLSLKDSYSILEDHITPKKKPLRDIKETEAHQKLFLELFKDKQKINYQNILKWHYKLFKETKNDIAGNIRNYQVGISQSKHKPPLPVELEAELRDFFKWYNKYKDSYHPVILSALIHLRFVEIHPFGDGNGRMSRILMNLVLYNYDYPLFIIDYKNRDSYYNALEKSHTRKDFIPFITWFLNRYLKFIEI